MKLIRQSLQIAELHMLKGLLEKSGIDCDVKRENITGLAGRIPMAECLAELWIINDEDFENAQKILNTYLNSDNAHKSENTWKCKQCGEEVEGQFDTCWKCGNQKE